jgi:hypothetical protein
MSKTMLRRIGGAIVFTVKIYRNGWVYEYNFPPKWIKNKVKYELVKSD